MENNKLKEAMIELTETGRYRDGGSISYVDQEGNKYWMDFAIGTKTRGMLYKGDINRDERKTPFNGSYSIKETMSSNYQQVNKTELQKAIEVLCNAFREDTTEGSYYGSWKDNISMSFQDEFSKQEGFGDVSRGSCKNIADQAAKNFLNLLIKK